VPDVRAAAAFYQMAFAFAKRGIMNGPDGKATVSRQIPSREVEMRGSADFYRLLSVFRDPLFGATFRATLVSVYHTAS
jgi:hypothetical protein